MICVQEAERYAEIKQPFIPQSSYTKYKLFNNESENGSNIAPTNTMFLYYWQCYKMPFHLCALHNPNPLGFVFTKQQTPQLSVEHLVVCLDEYLKKNHYSPKKILTLEEGMFMAVSAW